MTDDVLSLTQGAQRQSERHFANLDERSWRLVESQSSDDQSFSRKNKKKSSKKARHADFRSPAGDHAGGDEFQPNRSIEAESRRLARRGLRIARTPVGKGIFATKNFDRLEIIGEIEGNLCEAGSSYAFDLENGNLLEPLPPFRYVNHSCQPNCYFDYIDEPATDVKPASRRIMLLAGMHIWVGDELTIDYAWSWNHAIPCQCKAEECRGWIVASTQLEKLRESLNLKATTSESLPS